MMIPTFCYQLALLLIVILLLMYQEISYRSPPKNSNPRDPQFIKKEVDSLIVHDMHVLRQSKSMSREKLLVGQNNDLMLDYVRQIYNEYSIDDPLADVNLSRLTSQPSAKKTTKKQKIHLMSNHTLKYSISARNKTYQDQENPIQYSDQDQGLQNSRQLKRQLFNNSTIIQANEGLLHTDSHYRLKNYSLTDLLNNLDDSNRWNKNKRNKGQLEIQEEITYKFEEQIQNQALKLPTTHQTGPQYASEEVQQTFRYCVGCQCAILHVNIRSHQQICTQFISMSSLSKLQILVILRKKVAIMRQRIHQQSRQLHQIDVDQFKQSSLQLISQGKSAAQSGLSITKFEESYRSVIGVGKKWCLISQLGSKIKWFVKVIQNISKSMES